MTQNPLPLSQNVAAKRNLSLHLYLPHPSFQLNKPRTILASRLLLQKFPCQQYINDKYMLFGLNWSRVHGTRANDGLNANFHWGLRGQKTGMRWLILKVSHCSWLVRCAILWFCSVFFFMEIFVENHRVSRGLILRLLLEAGLDFEH